MTLSILGVLLPLEIGGVHVAWTSPIIWSLLLGSIVLGMLFLVTEGWVAKEPMMPLPMLRQRDVALSNLIMLYQSAAQAGLMFVVPLYFQVTSSASTTVAGAHLVPAVVGNAIGGILSGIIINRTRRYKGLIVVATFTSTSAYALLIIRWRGNTNWLESMYIVPGGFGMGIVQSALFVSVQAAIDPSHAAIAASTLYLTSSTGFLAGMSGVSAVLQTTLRKRLDRGLEELGFVGVERQDIIDHAVSNVRYAEKVAPLIARVIGASYIDALMWTHGK